MKLKNLVIVVGLLVIANGWSQTKLIEKVQKKGDEVVIPYEKYELENGLTLVLHEDHSDPLVHVDVTYHVGSAREELKKSGFAHFFEHMMFQGSENVADEEHFKIVSNAGGTLNGSTNRDRTNYYQTVPSNQLELMLWLEADRMGFFLDAVTQEKFEVQRATVKNEKGQNYDNQPYGRWREINVEALYPYGHPYSWLTIGKLEDLDRVDVNDLKQFFMRWYGPNNATLTVGGDINTKEVIKMVEKYFGVIPRGPEVESLQLAQVTLDADRYVSYVDNNIRFPALLFTYPTVPRYHPDEAALECLADILGTGQSSYLFKKFVKNQKALQASSFPLNDELGGELTLFALPYPGGTLSDFEADMRQVLADFEKAGVDEEDLIKFKANRESSIINGLASVSGKVSQLASHQTYSGNPNGITKDLERYQNITKEDVMRVYNTYIKDKSTVILSVLPDGDTAPAKPDNYVPQREGQNPFPTTDYSGLSYSRPTGDTFDRSIRPIPGDSPLVQVPEFWKDEFDNGLKIIGSKTDEIPVVALQLTINGGHKMDMYSPEKSGLAQLTASLMNESTENFSSEEIQEELRKIGSSINVSSNDSETTLRINSLKKNLPRTMELLNEVLYRPKFNQEDFDRLKKQQLEALKSAEKSPQGIANNVYRRLLYSDDHIYSVPPIGIEESVTKIQNDDVKEFYNNFYGPEISELVIVGDISKSEIMPHLSFLKSWESKGILVPKLPTAKQADKTKLYLVDKEEAPQSQIRIGFVTDMTYDATGEYFKSYLMNYNLGGAFNSRINLNLREDKGWTYGARSYYDSNDEPGPFTASAGVLGTATADAVSEFMKEITNYKKDGITDEELDYMRNSIGQRDARSYETPGQKARFLARIVHYDLDKTYVDKQTEIIKTISKKEINDLADKNLKTDQMNILVVGDKASNIEKLEELGYEIVELNVKGDLIKSEDKTEDIKE